VSRAHWPHAALLCLDDEPESFQVAQGVGSSLLPYSVKLPVFLSHGQAAVVETNKLSGYAKQHMFCAVPQRLEFWRFQDSRRDKRKTVFAAWVFVAAHVELPSAAHDSDSHVIQPVRSLRSAILIAFCSHISITDVKISTRRPNLNVSGMCSRLL